MYGLNQNSAPGLILVKTSLDELLDQSMAENAVTGKAEATDPVIFSQDTADNAAKNTSVLGGGGYFDIEYDDSAQNKSSAVAASALRTTLIANFKKNLPIPRTFMSDQQESAVERAVNQQAKTYIASRDRNAFTVFGQGFPSGTGLATVDGNSLYNVSHTNENGDSGIDNYYTGVLNDPNLNTLINALRLQLSQTGVILGYEPKYLLTASIIHQAGMATAKSVLRAGTGNNDLNYWSEMYPGMKVVYSPFLDGISTTAYFVGTNNSGVYRFDREAFFTRLVDWETSDNDNYQYKMRAREAVDGIEYSGTAASDGSVS